MLLVGRLAGELEAHQRNDGRSRVRKVVDSVRHNRNAARYKTGDGFHNEKQQIGDDTHNSGKLSVPLPHLGTVHVAIIADKKTNQKFSQIKSQPFPAQRKSEPPAQSIPTTSGKSSTTRRLTDSQPRSSNAITSTERTACAASAPAPPSAQRYTA